ncbi:MAG: methyltransferase domain-containing protein [Bacteroidia bacterium]
MPTIDELYWENRYKQSKTGWDIGEISLPLKTYFDQLTNKNIKILIPGCGNAYEAKYLLDHGFTNVHLIDISETLIQRLKLDLSQWIQLGHCSITKINFFDFSGSFDLIIEQTFFCAISPEQREQYVIKSNSLLAPKGKIVGLLFNHLFEENGPPFGGTYSEYRKLFEPKFYINNLNECYNSIAPRKGKELFFNFAKK